MDEIPKGGVIEVMPSITDYRAGAITAVIRNPSGDWRQYEPRGEWQKLIGVKAPGEYNTGGVDFLDCVSFSANNAIETLMNKQLPLYDAENVQWLRDNGYFNLDGTLNFSDRFVAKMSGTTKDGNSLPKVAQTIHENGLVPESLWPMPVDEIKAKPRAYWEIYYSEIPQAVKDMGQEFLKRFSHNYEWVFYPGSPATLSTVRNCLQIAPLQLATAVCAGWNTSTKIAGCGAGGQHATTMTFADKAGYYVLDHYEPFDKQFDIGYDITYAMRHIVLSLPPAVPVLAPLPDLTKMTVPQKQSLLARLKEMLAALLARK